MDYDKNKIIEKIKNSECVIDCHTHVGMSAEEYLTGGFPYCMSFEDLVVRMKLLGVSHAVAFPHLSSYYLREKMGISNDADSEIKLSAFPYEIENTRLFEEIYSVFPEYSDMALPFVMFDPSIMVEEQIEHLEKIVAQYPVFGMKTVTTYCKSFVSDFDGKGSALKEFARKHDLPILFHSSWRKEDIWANVYDIIKIAENNPDLRICVAHSARFSIDALEKAAKVPNCFVDSSALKIHCELALKDSPVIPPTGKGRLETDYNFPGKVMNDLFTAYPDTIIWGSDTPMNHFFKTVTVIEPVTLRLKSSYDSEVLALNALTPAQKRKVSYENTLRFLFGDKGK